MPGEVLRGNREAATAKETTPSPFPSPGTARGRLGICQQARSPSSFHGVCQQPGTSLGKC